MKKPEWLEMMEKAGFVTVEDHGYKLLVKTVLPDYVEIKHLKVVADEPVEIRFDIRAENPTTTEKEPNPREESIG